MWVFYLGGERLCFNTADGPTYTTLTSPKAQSPHEEHAGFVCIKERDCPFLVFRLGKIQLYKSFDIASIK